MASREHQSLLLLRCMPMTSPMVFPTHYRYYLLSFVLSLLLFLLCFLLFLIFILRLILIIQASAPFLSSLITDGAQALTSNISAVLNIQSGQVPLLSPLLCLSCFNFFPLLYSSFLIPMQIIPLVFYNALGWAREDYVVIPANAKGFNLVDQNQRSVPYQV